MVTLESPGKPSRYSSHNPSNIYIEKATISLVQEYLFRKNFRSTLKQLNHEEGSFEGLHNQRLALAKELKLEKLNLENKRNSEGCLLSILEVLVKAYIISQSQSLTISFSKNKTEPIREPKESKETQTCKKDLQAKTIIVETGVQTEDYLLSREGSFDRTRKAEADDKLYPNVDEASLSKSSTTSTTSGSKNHSIRNTNDNHHDHEVVEPLIPHQSNNQMNFDTEFNIKPRPQTINTNQTIATKGSSPSLSPNSEPNIAHNLLQSKRDTLVESWLTNSNAKKENSNRVIKNSTPEEQAISSVSSKVKNNEDSYTLEFEDIEDEDFGYSEGSNSGVKELVHLRNPTIGKSKTSQLDLKTWRELKVAVVGVNGMLQDGWIAQGFTFDSNISYGLVQKKGGPCGVLAAVQSILLRNLMFGSEFCDNLKNPSNKLEEFLTGEQKTNCLKSRSLNQEWILSYRSDALIGTLVEILWRCRNSKGDVLLCLGGNQPGSEVIQIESLEELKEYVQRNLYKFDCVGLVYSCVLTRGVDSTQEDMDFPNSPLLGQHGYCSQELINLLLFGKCISNAFDNEVLLDEKVLKGIPAQSDIGLLSLFEYYGSFQVGSFFKNPKYPVWLVCSESHFSCLFSTEINLVSDEKEKIFYQFQLFFYDGLARQDDTVRLTISLDGTSQGKSNKTVQYVGKGFQNDENNEDNLIPPLEKCIRTKWYNSSVCWNGSEPIL